MPVMPKMVVAGISWETRQREQQQTLRDRIRNTRRNGNPHMMQPVEDDVHDVTAV